MARISREESRSITVEKLRRAALQEFAQNGFAGAAIDRITETAGFSRGAFYANYNSKEEILLDLLRDQQSREVAKWSGMVYDADNMESMYARMEQRFKEYLGEANWGLFLVEVQLYAKRNVEFSVRFKAYLREIDERVRILVSQLFEKAGVAPPVDISELANLMRSMVVGLSLDADEGNTPADAARRLILFIRSMIALGETRQEAQVPA